MNTHTPPDQLQDTAPVVEPIGRVSRDDLPVVVIGAGPVGLAAAAHLLERGLEPVILEAAPIVGAAVRDWGHVAMFSPWQFDLDRACVALLEKNGWTAPAAEAFPTGRDLTERYLDPLAATPDIASRLRLGHRVIGVARTGMGKVKTAGREEHPFEVRFVDGNGNEGRVFAKAVIDASGTWSHPNPAGASGLPAIGERAASNRIRYGMPDVLGLERARYAGRRVLVVGSGHSATGTLLDLATLADEVPGTSVVWAVRSPNFTRIFGGGGNDQLPARGALGERLRGLVESGAFEIVAPFAVDQIMQESGGGLTMIGEGRTIAVDQVIMATGLRPDLTFLGEVPLDLDPALECPKVLAPLIDPNVHSCGTVRPHGAAELSQPDPSLFLVGMKSYGRAPTFLLATGYEQVRSVVAHLAGDAEAAKRVELCLPETGICSLGPAPIAEEPTPAAACCGPKSPAQAGGCCGPAVAA